MNEMLSISRKYEWALEKAHYLIGWLGIIILILMGIFASLQVVFRAIPSGYIPFSTIWTVEVTRYLLALMAAVGVPYAMRTDTHISVRPLIERLSNRWYRIFILFSNLMVILLSVIVVISGALVSRRTIDQSLRTVGWFKIGYIHLFLSLMFLIAIIYALDQTYKVFKYPEEVKQREQNVEESISSEGIDNE